MSGKHIEIPEQPIPKMSKEMNLLMARVHSHPDIEYKLRPEGTVYTQDAVFMIMEQYKKDLEFDPLPDFNL